MDWLALVGAAFVLGLTGGVHCLAMCAGLQQSALQASPRRVIPLTPLPTDGSVPAITDPTCVGASQSARPSTLWTLLEFHTARVCGYALLGAAVAGSSSTLRWAAQWAGPLKTLWILLNAAVLSLGLVLALRGAMPHWIDHWNHRVWQGIRTWRGLGQRPAAGLWGLLWAFLPCGLLASAASLALLTSDATRGAAVMASFGVGTAIDLLIMQSVWQGLRRRIDGASLAWQTLGIRLSGLMLTTFAAVALWSIARGQPHPFCAS
jgi:sulfite exporter TauE/SafE